MKQVLFVCAGSEFPLGAFNFLVSMHRDQPVEALGLFFSPMEREEMAIISRLPVQAPYERLTAREKQSLTANKTLFARQCAQHHIRYRIHDNEEQWDKPLFVKESRFADLILLSGELFYGDLALHQPNSYLQDALHSAECPVLAIPEEYKQTDHLFIAYDGSKESLLAMKQFSYLFPGYTDLPAEVVYIRDEASDEIPDFANLRFFTRLHFGSIGFSKLHFKAARYFASWINEKQHVLLITGSYGRAPFSYATKRSFAQQVIHDHRLPVFIAHS